MIILIKMLICLAGANLSIICYRLGGSAYFNTKVRDIGSPLFLCMAITPWMYSHPWVLLMLFVSHFAACTPGYGGECEPVSDQSQLYRWFKGYTFMAVGCIFGIAALPLLLVGANGYLVFMRTLGLVFAIQALHDYRVLLFHTRGLHNFFEDIAEMEEILRWTIVLITFAIIFPR